MVQGPNGEIYVRSYGQPTSRTPLIVLHGGPAAGHRYMRPYARLAADRRTIFYDQSGCGRSARPADLGSYTVDTYVRELEAVRAWSGAAQVILLGHSWGGALALAYAAAYPQHVAGLVLAGTAARIADFETAAQRWLAAMGPDAVRIAATEENVGGAPSARFQALQDAYYREHLLRLPSWPDWFTQVAEEAAGNPVYRYLNGPSEFRFTGALSSLDLTDTLPALRVPTLITCGEFDEAPPWVGSKLAARIHLARLHTWPGLSHMAHIEAPQTVVPATAHFLHSIDRTA
ncbi:proline iminopeptidase-family hydrolase [Sphingomonas sp.]|uniref:proline iminopeptidase-family hydrolase n=1 Tax=Sphingomonas sp. TaxID=28214 RepID=UPI003B3A4C8E